MSYCIYTKKTVIDLDVVTFVEKITKDVRWVEMDAKIERVSKPCKKQPTMIAVAYMKWARVYKCKANEKRRK